MSADKQIIIQLDPTVDFQFELGNLLSFDEDRIPSVCDEMFEKYLIKQYTPQEIVKDLPEDDWYIFSVKYLGKQHVSLLISLYEDVNDADALFIAERKPLDEMKVNVAFIFDELDRYADYLNTENWRVFLYKNDEPYGREDMKYSGKLMTVIPQICKDLPGDYQSLLNAGKYEVRY